MLKLKHLDRALTHEQLLERSRRLREAGYEPRDTRLTCERCGAKVTAQMLPIHKCPPTPA